MSEFFNLFLDSVEEGVWAGVVIGLYDHKEIGWLHTDAVEFLNRETYSVRGPKERGIRAALRELGFLRRTLFGRYVRTDKRLAVVGNGRTKFSGKKS